jgi:DNA-binding transcriptional ArsR family regulator
MDTHIGESPTEGQFGFAVETLKILADNTRLRIVWTLLHGEHAVGELAEHLGVQPAAVSQHLAKLRMAHVVKIRRDGNRLFYAVDDAHVRHLVEESLFHSHHVAEGHTDHATAEPTRHTAQRQPA